MSTLADLEAIALDLEALAEERQHARCDLARVPLCRHAFAPDGEFVPAQARDLAESRAATLVEALGQALQQDVANRVAERVVDLLEAVEVDQEQRRGHAGRKARRDAPVQVRAIGQSREGIVHREVLECPHMVAPLELGSRARREDAQQAFGGRWSSIAR